MNLQNFKDQYAISKGFDSFANMTIKTLITNEDWHTYNDLINEMLDMLQRAKDKLYTVQSPSTSYRMLGDEIEQLIKQATEL